MKTPIHPRHHPTLAVLTWVSVVGAAACAGASEGAAPVSATPPSATSSPADARTDGLAELEALYRARADSALMRFSEADVEFMTRMIGHHGQALVMAALVPDRASDPALRTLAARVTNAQQDEIDTMRRWLEDRGRPAPPVEADPAAHAAHGPGMLTPEELQQLERASASDFDRLFLALMIRHHEGAITMVHELFATDGAASDPSVFKIASDIQVDQRTEIARMQRMLDALAVTQGLAGPGGIH